MRLAVRLFLGKFDHVLDAKGRLAIPSRFRDGLGAQAVITRGAERCLVVYPEPAWAALRAAIASLPISDPNARMFRRFMFAEAAPLELDSQGRVIVSPALRAHAGIDRAAVIVGMDSTIEIWSLEAWRSIEAELASNAATVMDRLHSVI